MIIRKETAQTSTSQTRIYIYIINYSRKINKRYQILSINNMNAVYIYI